MGIWRPKLQLVRVQGYLISYLEIRHFFSNFCFPHQTWPVQITKGYFTATIITASLYLR